MNLPPFLWERDGEIRLTGHRISLYDVLNYYRRGLSPERVQERLPSISLEQVCNVLAFSRDNQAEVDAYLARHDAERERLERELPSVDMEDIKQRAEANGIDLAAIRKWATEQFGDDLL
jgi:uncharacterized protein (DUF433 family)